MDRAAARLSPFLVKYFIFLATTAVLSLVSRKENIVVSSQSSATNGGNQNKVSQTHTRLDANKLRTPRLKGGGGKRITRRSGEVQVCSIGAEDQRVNARHHIRLVHQIVHHIRPFSQLTLSADNRRGR